MPNDLSNEFHADLDAIWADIQGFIKTAETDLEALARESAMSALRNEPQLPRKSRNARIGGDFTHLRLPPAG